MARPGAYKSEKRRKELMRQKKQEEKRKRRLQKKMADQQSEFAGEGAEDEGTDNVLDPEAVEEEEE